MSTTLGFVIRDGLETDIAACLALDHHYETDFVWQMGVEDPPGQWHIHFHKQRLPRTLETIYSPNEKRLRNVLAPDDCFLVAVAKEGNEILGYLTMRTEPVYSTAWVQDIVVTLPYRRHRIGTRLVNVARQWAKEHGIKRLTAECSTQNFPGIAFCQQLGFRLCGYSDQYYPNHDIAVFLSQSLP
jgi:GNAT superfamily N-acetyltransferase